MDTLRLPRNFIKEYRSLEILMNRFNIIAGPYILMLVNNVSLTLSVGGQIMIIMFHVELGLGALMLTCLVSFLATVFLVITYFKFGEINENSKQCISSWKRNLRFSNHNLHDTKLVVRQIRSLGVCRIELGSFGYYKKSNNIRIIGKIIYYTVKGLMLLTELSH